MLDAVLSAGSVDLPVEEYDPNRGGESYELLQARATANDWSRQPVFRSGTRLEIGVFDEELLMLDGKVSRDYLPRRFTRWAQHAAFEDWTAYLSRGFAVASALAESGTAIDGRRFAGRDEINRFYLVHESQRATCDAAGRRFADLLQRGFVEGQTAPGVTIEYRPCTASAASS